jgi:hypothetical protein
MYSSDIRSVSVSETIRILMCIWKIITNINTIKTLSVCIQSVCNLNKLHPSILHILILYFWRFRSRCPVKRPKTFLPKLHFFTYGKEKDISTFWVSGLLPFPLQLITFSQGIHYICFGLWVTNHATPLYLHITVFLIKIIINQDIIRLPCVLPGSIWTEFETQSHLLGPSFKLRLIFYIYWFV